jgi:hypothetical protein
MRAQVVPEQEQRARQKEEDSYVETEQGARVMAAEVTATLAEPGMMGKCFESMTGGSKIVQGWTTIVRNYGKTKRKKQLFFLDMRVEEKDFALIR